MKNNTSPSTAVLNVEEITLVLRHVHAKEQYLNSLERNLQKSPAQYPIVHPQMSTYLVPSGANAWQQDGVFNGKIPNRIFFGFVTNKAFNGQKDLNPFDFKHLNATNVKLTIDGQEPCPPIKMDHAKMLAMEGYHRLLSSLNMTPMMISFDHFSQGSAIYGFDLTPKGNCMNEQFVLRRQGNLRIEVSFGVALSGLHNIVILGEFDGVITIDSNRNVKRSW
eukprot:Seg1537.1 transcript_id=Seg1537.1/GoldUCD/mRNA.D3Y31 product="putative protein F54H12.2" protein_id=Seg1537.1/GoldUCD/D3Y31